MKNIILIRGSPDEQEYRSKEYPSPSNSHWLPWLQKQAITRDVLCQTPEFPHPYEPVYEEYLQVFEQFVIHSETVLVGHSSGAGFLLKYLSEHQSMAPAQVVLVAPWIDPDHEFTTDFFGCVFDPRLAERYKIDLFISADDDESMQQSLAIITKAISGITIHEFSDRGHFCTREFPELETFIFSMR